MVNAPCTPVITVSQDVYEAILLAERVMVVAGGPAVAVDTGGGLPDLFSVRQCFLTTAGDAPAAFLRRMVGG